LFENKLCEDAEKNKLEFWVLVKALKIFRGKNDNFLPVSHKIPDMFS